MDRPGWDEYFMSISELVATRSTCLKKKTGALIVRDKRILATGYSGAPTGIQHCLSLGCMREKLGIPDGEKLELCRGIHATQNALIQAATLGVSTKDSTLYTSNLPCIICIKLLINAGIKRIVVKELRQEHNIDIQRLKETLLKEAGIEISLLKGEQ